MRRILWSTAVAAVVGVALAAPAVAATPPAVAAAAGGKDAKQAKPAQQSAETQVRFSTVLINDREVLRLGETEALHADERAEKVRERLRMVLMPNPGEAFKPVKATEVTVESVDGATVVRLRNQNVAQVTPEDAALAHMAIDELGETWADALRAALKDIPVSQAGRPPEDLITIATGEMTLPTGGGAGGAPKRNQPKPDR